MPPQNELSQNLNPQNFLISQIANGLATTTELVQGLSSEIRDNTISLATLRAELTGVTQDVTDLSRILKDGNGTQPVLSRVAVLEKSSSQAEASLAALNSEIDDLKEKVNALYEKFNSSLEQKRQSTEDSRSRVQNIIAIVTSIIAFIASIVAALLA